MADQSDRDLPGALPEWVTSPTYVALHTDVPTREQGHEPTGGHYARVSVGAPAEWDGVSRKAHFTAPVGGDLVTHAYLIDTDGVGQWFDMTTDPITPCAPPPGWVDVEQGEQ